MGHIRGIVLHGTRSGRREFGINGDRSEGLRTLHYTLTPGTTSYNFLVDFDGTIYETVPPGTAAWHAQENNWTHLGIGAAQAVDGDELTDEQYTSLRWLIDRECKRYMIPRRRVISQFLSGIAEHRDIEQGQRSGKSDIGSALDWARLL